MLLAFTLIFAVDGAAMANADYSVVERGGVRIESSVKAHLYTWKITNNTDLPITRFEVAQDSMYNQQVPPGWMFQYDDQHDFMATATELRYGIQPGRTAEFSARGSSHGGLLTLKPAVVGFGPYQADIRFEAVWTAIGKPSSLIALVAGTICALALLHAWLLRRKPVRIA